MRMAAPARGTAVQVSRSSVSLAHLVLVLHRLYVVEANRAEVYSRLFLQAETMEEKLTPETRRDGVEAHRSAAALDRAARRVGRDLRARVEYLAAGEV